LQTLGHFDAIHGEKIVMYPKSDKLVTCRAFTLRDFIFMVHWDMVDATSMYIDCFAQVLHTHRTTFDMPSWESITPWRRPVHCMIRIFAARVRLDGGPTPGAKIAGADALTRVVEFALSMSSFSVVVVPTRTGTTARMISRFKPAEWIVAVSRHLAVAQGLQFSCGVLPHHLEAEPESWGDFVRESLKGHGPTQGLALLVAGPSVAHPDTNHRIEFGPF
jgi:hypothetical protein